MQGYSYIPRICIVPGEYEKARIDELVRCCKKYGYDEIMFFINGENLFQGFLDKDDIKEQVACIKRAQAELNKIGVKTSLNPWTSLGHGYRGHLGICKDRFQKMVGDKGFADPLVVCPLDEDFQEYFADYYAYLVKEIHPHILWVEDDFRFAHGLNASGNEWGSGCFCDAHMKLYSEYVGRKITVDEMREGMATGAENGVFRRAFYQVNRKVLRAFAEKLSARVQAVDPEVKIGLMVGDAKAHSTEGRDWEGLLRGFGGQNAPVVRIHGPMFRQVAPQDYCWLFNDISMQARALAPEETVVLPELENAMFSPYTKSRKMTCFQVECAQALCPSGMTFDQDCFAGGGIVDAYGYGQPLAEIKRYLNAFYKEKVRFSTMDGIIVPATEDGFLRVDGTEKIAQGKNVENYWASHLASVGVAYKYDKKGGYENKIVAIAGNYLRGLTDEQMERLFAKNFLILDGDSVKILFERGLNRLIRAKSYKQCAWAKGEFSFEQAEKGRRYLNMDGARTSSLVTCPDCLAIEYEEPPTVYTNLMGYKEEYVAPCMVRFDNCFIMPYVVSQPAIYSPAVKEKHHGLLATMRESVLKDALLEVKAFDSPVLFNRLPYVSTYYYKEKSFDYLLLANFSDDDYDDLQMQGLPAYKKAWVCNRKDGKWKRVKVKDGRLQKCVLPCETTLLFKFER